MIETNEEIMVTGHDIHEYLGINAKQDSTGVYVGYQEINGTSAPTKVGRSKNAHALQRLRAQGGASWWFVAYFLLPTNADTYTVEKEWKRQMKSQNLEKTQQRQTELYYLSPEDAADEMEGILRSMGYEVRDLVDEILENQLHG